MAITVETGAGIAAAESYVTVVACDTYWTNRAHTTLGTTWAAASTANKEGALREASAYMDAVYNYRGYRKGTVQGLEWPRTEAMDDTGFPLPDLPQQVVDACCELAARALSERLAEDADISGSVKRERKKVGPIETETEYTHGGSVEERYGYVSGMLKSVLKIGTGWEWR